MLQISDVRGSWACMNLAKQIGHIIKICISTINGKKRCSKNCGLLVTISVALNWITIKTFVFNNFQQRELKTSKQMPLTVYIFQVSIKVEVLNVKQAK